MKLLVSLKLLLILLIAPKVEAGPWHDSVDPGQFFNDVASRLLKTQLGLELTHLQLYPNNQYSAEAHRLCQLTANLFEATRQGVAGEDYPYLPTVFRPVIQTGPNDVVELVGYEPLDSAGFYVALQLGQLRWWRLADLAQSPSPGPGPIDFVYEIPLLIGARKGLPNFNEFAMQSHVQATRKLEFVKTDLDRPPVQTNQMFILGVSNVFAMESWYPYTNGLSTNFYPRELEIFAAASVSSTLTNDAGFVRQQLFATNSGGFVRVTNNTWGGRTSESQFHFPIQAAQIVLPDAVYYPDFPHFVPVGQTNSFDRSGHNYTNQWGLTVTNRLLYFVFDLEVPGGPHLVDAVSLDGLVTTLDVSELLNARGPTASFIDDTWNIQPEGNVTVGVMNQICVSLGEVDVNVDWRSYGIGNLPNGQEKLKAIDTFRYFMDPLQMVFPVLYYATNSLLPMSFAMQAPFTVTRKIVQTTSWQANDPLVHYRVSDLRDRMNLVQIVTTGPNITLSLMRDFNLGKINDRYRPWGGRFGYPTSIDEMNPALVDPLLWNPDYWDFPVGQPPGTAWLGRVHRGTPWQTLYLKSAALSATDWTNQGQVMASHPTNDWAVAEELVAMLNTQSPLQLLSINNTNRASWLAILDGMEVVTNTIDGCVVEVVSSNSPGAIAVYQGIQRERNGRPGKLFREVREILSVPELSLSSPWIDPEQWWLCPNDAAYEAIPAQILPQLRADPVGSIVPLGQNWRITFTGWDGFSYRVEQSTDLQHWGFYGTFVSEERGISFTIPTPEPGTSQFFRAILIP